MDDKQKEKLKMYGQLKLQEKSIKTQIDETKAEVQEIILESGADKIDAGIGFFVIKKVKKWIYSDIYNESAKALKQLKADEEASGAAEFEYAAQVEFRGNKD